MQNKFFLVITILMCAIAHAQAQTADDPTQTAINTHFNKYKEMEYFSGISTAILIPGQPIKTYVVGNVAHDTSSPKITPDTLFNIGSITKSFTAAIMLQLEKEKKLQLSDTLGNWLPDYAKWSSITLTSMLDMTCGLPNYSDSPLMNAEEYKDYTRNWSSKDLLSYVYPPANFTPPLKAGYAYTNTGYILSSMIIEKITSQPFKSEIEARLFKPANLQNTFYPIPQIPTEVVARLAHGYAYNPYSNPEILGKDMQLNNLTWAAAAGAIISTPSDVIRWTEALFSGEKILDANQKAKLQLLVSTTTGKPIQQTSASDTKGFGLGVSQAYDRKIGRFWFYEGQTEGYRALFMYVPANGIIVSCIFNSAVDGSNDHAGELLMKLYELTTTSPRV